MRPWSTDYIANRAGLAVADCQLVKNRRYDDITYTAFLYSRSGRFLALRTRSRMVESGQLNRRCALLNRMSCALRESVSWLQLHRVAPPGVESDRCMHGILSALATWSDANEKLMAIVGGEELPPAKVLEPRVPSPRNDDVSVDHFQ